MIEISSSVEQSSYKPLFGRALLPENRNERVIALATFVNMLGVGSYLAANALYFTSVAGLSAREVGAGFAFGSILGIVTAVPLGHMADRLGPREVYAASQLLGAIVSASFILVDSFWTFCALVGVSSINISASQSSQGALIAGISKESPTRFRSYLRAVMNLSFTIGGLLAGVVIQNGSRTAFVTLLIGVASSYFISSIMILGISRVSAPPRPSMSGRRNVLRDRSYVLVTILSGLVYTHHAILTFGLPLWIIHNTDAPRWLVAGAFFTNTAIVAIFQVRASRRIHNVADAGRRMRPAAVALLVSIALMGGASEFPQVWASLILLVAIIGYSMGEIWHASASYEMAFGLAPKYAQGQYYGAFTMGQSTSAAFSPLLIGAVCLGWQMWGWMAFAFTVAGAAIGLGELAIRAHGRSLHVDAV